MKTSNIPNKENANTIESNSLDQEYNGYTKAFFDNQHENGPVEPNGPLTFDGWLNLLITG